jgi:putative addiction module CopG family antidote
LTELETVSITLTGPMLRAIQEAVETGEYVNAGEVVRDALRLWNRQRRRGRSALSDPSQPAGGRTD